MGWTIVDDFAAVLPLFGFFNDFSAFPSSMVFTILEDMAAAFCL